MRTSDEVIGAVLIGLFVVAIVVSAIIHQPLIVVGLVAAAAVIAAVRYHQKQADEEKRAAARAAYEEREAERDKEGFLDDVDRYFPFIRTSFQERLKDGQAPEDAFLDALYETPAVQLGTTFFDLPALLPLEERRKHLYVVGKTGSGKTNLLLHLIREDLEQGRGVGVIAPETELFRDWLLPLVPEARAREVIYFAPGNPDCPLTFNPLSIEPGDDQARAAGELFAIFKRAIGDEGMGARMAPILGSAFAVLVGRPGATLWDVKRLLEDPRFREEVAATTPDPYLQEFWLRTYPSYPKGSHLSVINRLDQFLRPPQVRKALTHPTSSFSIRDALSEGKILFIELGRLAPDSMLLLGQMLLSKFQLELMRREAVPIAERKPFYLYADEFQTFAGVSEETWSELLARGRRYGVGLTLANQHPSQLPRGLQNEIFGNVASLVALNVSAKDANVVRREFLEPANDGTTKSIPAEAMVEFKVGQAIARLGGGGFALPLRVTPPFEEPPQEWGERIRAVSWDTYGVAPEPKAEVVYHPHESSSVLRAAEPAKGYRSDDDVEDEVID